MSIPLAQVNSLVQQQQPDSIRPVVVVGTGMAGIHAVNELLRWNPHCPIVVYGAEPWAPYDRVKLSSMLAGDVRSPQLVNDIHYPIGHNVTTRYNLPIISIDRQAQTVTDKRGEVQVYDKLILALGSRPHVPAIPGVDLKGVYTFRDMSDAQHLMARQSRSRRTLVLGGGLLGLESARAMQRGNTDVVVVEHGAYLMYHQLDESAAEILRERVMALGIKVMLNDGVQQIIGDNGVSGVLLRSGKTITCDTVVIATGIRPNTELALSAGLSIGRGIRVNDLLQTSDPNIYAVGECCEHRDTLYGLVAPGLEQAAVAAHNIANKQNAKYHGSLLQTQLKVVGHPVLSMGDVQQLDRPDAPRAIRYEKPEAQVYRKIVLRRNRLVGVIAIGEGRDAGLLTHAFETRQWIWPWQLYRFKRSGQLWNDSASNDVRQWPAAAIVCNCRSVNRKTLTDAVNAGANTIELLVKQTQACTVCGSCQPLLAALCGSPVATTKVKAQPVLLGSAILALLLALLFLAENPFDSRYQVSTWWLSNLWIDSWRKQITGFVLLGLSVTGVLIALSKRWGKLFFKSFTLWKGVHVISGLLIVTALLIHTGLHLGGYLNTLLLSTYLLAALAGISSAIASGLGSGGNQQLRRSVRAVANWTHLLALWPFPVLVGLHILTVYYY